MQENRSIIQKADFLLAQLAPGGLLLPEQARQFVRLLIDKAVVMPLMTEVSMTSAKVLKEKVQFGSSVLRKGTEAVALPLADRSRPDTSKVELDAQLVKAECRLSFESMEDNIEQNRFEQTVQEILADRISLDLENLAFNGDTTSLDTLLMTLDGFLKQATTNIVPCGSATLSTTVLKDVLKTMPSAFRMDRRALRNLTADEAVIDYHDDLALRETTLGDEHILSGETRGYGGIPLLGVPVFPVNLGGTTDETSLLLTDPANMLFGIHRQIRIETDKDISAGVYIIVMSARVDFKFAHEPAVVKATAIKAV